jgi:hypothetical protein
MKDSLNRAFDSYRVIKPNVVLEQCFDTTDMHVEVI